VAKGRKKKKGVDKIAIKWGFPKKEGKKRQRNRWHLAGGRVKLNLVG